MGITAILAGVAKTAAFISGMFSSRQKQAEREQERATGAQLGNLDAAEKGMEIADEIGKKLAEQSTPEEIDETALAVARRRAKRK
ncbi:hypothetical protein LCGC14_1849670 [marine sediment metagenome]|uniref:Uncharacterized protein n=1 Tax=marine sediment metagenome TaxID=412755 RepID=A0A0F9GZ12_9ZZZZ